ncbi:MAG: hypothetical protein UZ22_OP11002000225 [Microgenomates bacterium OLB23]|nr:MAG: hypothetical protein UZ22_OP11002000225 [Microgenomates bacterium OLB23]
MYNMPMLTIFVVKTLRYHENFFVEAKKTYIDKGYDIVDIAHNELSELEREVAFTSTLFAAKRVYCIENILNKKLNRDKLAAILYTTPEVVVWEETTDERTLKFAFPQAKIYVSKFSASLWKLLDSMAPGNLVHTVAMLREVQQSNDIHLVHFMLMRRIKELIIVSHGGQPAKLATWQIGKLKSQAALWKPDLLESLYKKLIEIEMRIKSGTMVYELNKALEITLSFYL